MRGLSSFFLVAGLPLLAAFSKQEGGVRTVTSHDTVFVSMVKGPGAGVYHFRPDSVLVKRGDVIRFTNESNTIHNVQFLQVPEGADVGPYKRGPFLMTKGETYSIVIGEGFVPGTYIVVCAPHVSMSMSGRITVQR